MSISITNHASNSLHHNYLQELPPLQARCPRRLTVGIELADNGYLISYSYNGSEGYYIADSDEDLIRAVELVIDVTTAIKDALV